MMCVCSIVLSSTQFSHRLYAVLKDRALFTYSDDKVRGSYDVHELSLECWAVGRGVRARGVLTDNCQRNDKISLDGCDVTLANKTNWAARSNSVLITHPTRVRRAVRGGCSLSLSLELLNS